MYIEQQWFNETLQQLVNEHIPSIKDLPKQRGRFRDCVIDELTKRIKHKYGKPNDGVFLQKLLCERNQLTREWLLHNQLDPQVFEPL